jgi:hypothetical protein
MPPKVIDTVVPGDRKKVIRKMSSEAGSVKFNALPQVERFALHLQFFLLRSPRSSGGAPWARSIHLQF